VQAPEPLQTPVWPQLAAPMLEQAPCGSPLPFFTAPQMPSAPWPFLAAEQASQVMPVQAVVQQTPSEQKPLEHWSPAVQAVPVPSWGVHWWLALQYAPLAHWLSAVHMVVQAPFEQRKGAQLWVAGEGATQTRLVQLCARVTTVALPLQVAAGQSALLWHPQSPAALQYSAIPPEDVPHWAPEWMASVGFPFASHA
jgi:hypothetical protein